MRAKFNPTVALVLVAVLALALPVAIPAQAGFQKELTYDAQTLVLANLIGEIRIEGGGSEFVVEVTARGADSSRDLIHIEQSRGDRAEVAIMFPLDEETRYVYPELGKKSKTTFHFNESWAEEGSWWKKVWGSLKGKKVEVRGSGGGLELWADVTIRVPEGGKLIVRHGVGQIDARNLDGDLNLDSNSGAVAVTAVNGSVLVDTGSGSVTVENVTGDINVDTGSGSVEITNCQGDILADTGSGSVDFLGCRGEEIKADTGSGNVTAENVDCRRFVADTGSGRVRARSMSVDTAVLDTGSGSIDLILDRMGTGRFVLDTGSGSVKLAVPPDASATVSASTGSGSISVDFEEEGVVYRAKDHLEFQIGDGEADVDIDTGSGSVHVTGT